MNRSSFVVCVDAIIGRREKQFAIATPFCIARESPLQKGALPNGGSSSFQTVTHFATGKHLSDALLPPPPPSPSTSPERKNGNTLIQSGVTKRPAFS